MCRQQHPYVPTTPPTPRETHTHARVCTHTRHLHARIPYMHTGEDNTRTRLHPCGTGARTGPGTKRCHRQPDTGPGPSQTPHSRQPDNGRDDRRRHNGYHDRARNGVNPAPREQNRVARVCVRACTGARALGWVRTGLRVRGCGVFFFFARAGVRARGSAMEWCVQVCLYDTGAVPGACPGEAALTAPACSLRCFSRAPVWVSHLLHPPWSPRRQVCRDGRHRGDGDAAGMGTSRGWGPQGRPCAGGAGAKTSPRVSLQGGGQGHQGVWEAPAPPRLSSPPWVTLGWAPRGALHLAAPKRVPSALRSPQVMGGHGQEECRGGGGGGHGPQPRGLPHRPLPGDRAVPPGTGCPRRAAGSHGCILGGFCRFWCSQPPMAARVSAGRGGGGGA